MFCSSFFFIETEVRIVIIIIMASSCGRVKATSNARHSNLECFLKCVTPTVQSQFLPKTNIHDHHLPWQPIGKDPSEYFILSDLWECYDEWSAYGAGTPILLSTGETVVQYYVPYLSSIQMYISRNPKEENELTEFESDAWSEESESDKLSGSPSDNSSKGWDIATEDWILDQEGGWLMRDRLGSLYFEYDERCLPHARVPLKDKIIELAKDHQGLMTFKNVDLSPASWMAVAWYPIYHIPTGRSRNMKDLAACFLTYHTLSSSFQDSIPEEEDCKGEDSSSLKGCIGGGKSSGEGNGGISLSPFGLATYKMFGRLWINPATSDQKRVVALLSAADSWLKQLRVEQHDFNYFITHC